MRKTILAGIALGAILAAPFLAHANNGNGNQGTPPGQQTGGFTTFGGFGAFATQGAAVAGSIGTGRAESFGDSGAGLTFRRAAGGFDAAGWTTNSAGSQSEGNAAGAGAASGLAFGAGWLLGRTTTRTNPGRHLGW